jgi:hypothetical protein
MSHFVKAAGSLAVSAGPIAVAVAGGATVIPLTPVLIGLGLLSGTLVAVSYIISPRGRDSKIKKAAKIQTSKGGDKFYVQSLVGDFCSAELGSDFRLTCNRKNVQEWEYFEVLKMDDGRFAFQASNKKYVSADRNKGGLLIADRDQIDDWEMFSIEQQEGAYVAIKASNGKYVSRTQDGNFSLKATATSIGKSELFRTMINRDQITMKDPITITKKIVIEKTIEVKIDIIKHEEAVKHQKGWFWGVSINWWDPEKAREGVKAGVTEKLDATLKSSIEEQIDIKLSSMLCEEVSQQITEELEKNKIVATVITEMK